MVEFGRLCEVQSDKATIEITSRYSGSVQKLHHAQGSIVKVGATLVDIRVEAKEGDAGATGVLPQPTPTPAGDTGAMPQPTPTPGTSGLAGAKGSVGATGAAPQSAPAATGSASPCSSEAYASVEVHRDVPAPAARTATTAHPESDARKVLSTPAVRQLAREKNVDLLTVEPSGEGGRVLKEDVLR